MSRQAAPRRVRFDRLAACLAAALFLFPATPARADVALGPPPEIRVLILENGSVSLSADDGFRVDGAGPSRVYPGPASLRAASETDGISLAVAGAEASPARGLFWAVRPTSGVLRVNGVPYRGRVVLAPRGGGIGVVNVVELEEYLVGVVPKEIGPVSPSTFEALRAQAIAARTYALRNLGKNDVAGFDLFGDVRDQAYGGVASETPLATQAVSATAGYVLVEEENRPAVLYYHSTCGGTTVAAGEIWPAAEREHLVPRSDRIDDGAGGETDACAWSRWHRWRRELDGAAVRRIFRTAGLAGTPARFEILARALSGRIRILVLETSDGAETRVEGDLAIRRLLGETALLPSTFFDMNREGGRVVLTGRGAGHGVGMCQAGAIGRARAGQSAEQILDHYYPGAGLQRKYAAEEEIDPPAAPPRFEAVPETPARVMTPPTAAGPAVPVEPEEDAPSSPPRIRRARPDEY